MSAEGLWPETERTESKSPKSMRGKVRAEEPRTCKEWMRLELGSRSHGSWDSGPWVERPSQSKVGQAPDTDLRPEANPPAF